MAPAKKAAVPEEVVEDQEPVAPPPGLPPAKDESEMAEVAPSPLGTLRVIGLYNRDRIDMPDGSVVTVRLGQEVPMPAERAKVLVEAGLAAYV